RVFSPAHTSPAHALAPAMHAGPQPVLRRWRNAVRDRFAGISNRWLPVPVAGPLATGAGRAETQLSEREPPVVRRGRAGGASAVRRESRPATKCLQRALARADVTRSAPALDTATFPGPYRWPSSARGHPAAWPGQSRSTGGPREA